MTAKGRNAPFVRISVPFLLGTVIGSYFPGQEIGPLITVAMLVAWWQLIRDKSSISRSKLKTPSLLLLLVMLGYHSQSKFLHEPKLPRHGEQCIGFIKEAIRTGNGWSDWNIEWVNKSDGKLLGISRTRMYSENIGLASEDIILGFPKFRIPVGPEMEGGFDEKTYLRSRNIFLKSTLNEHSWIKLRNSNMAQGGRVDAIRNHVEEIGRRYVTETSHFGLFMALTSGDRDYVPKEVSEMLASVGVVHVLAVSGLHVGLVYGLVFGILGWIPIRKWRNRIQTPVILLILVLYTHFTGATPSVIRASTMLSIYLLGKWIGRNPGGMNIVFMCLFGMLVLQPNMAYHPGFQLSFLAVIAILWIYPRLKKIYYPNHPLLQKGIDLLYISLAAQMGTSILAIRYFHQFPNYFLVSNLILAPILVLVLYGCLLLIATSPFVALSKMIALGLSWLIKLALTLAEWISSLPYAVTHSLFIDAPIMWAGYSFSLLITLWLLFRIRRYWIPSVLLFMIMVGTVVIIEKQDQSSGEWIEFGNRNKICVYKKGRHGLILISNEPDRYPKWVWNQVSLYTGSNHVRELDTILLMSGKQHQNVTYWTLKVVSSESHNVSFNLPLDELNTNFTIPKP